jgi:hypothetical protein
VNDPPQGLTTAATVLEDSTLTLPLATFDADGDDVSCTLATSPATGAATVPADCSRLVFAPSADYFGELPIRIAIDDGIDPSEFTVTVTVDNVNDPPVAGDDEAKTDFVTAIDIPVLGNDRDVDGDPLSITIRTQPPAGSATVIGSAVRYTPTFGVAGTHSFTYRVCDPSNACDTATVSVAVSALTIVDDDYAQVPSGTLSIIQVSDNDIPGSGRWFRPTFQIVDEPDFGRARTLGWGRIAYTSVRGRTGTDTLMYEVCDTEGSCDSATVTIEVSEGR